MKYFTVSVFLVVSFFAYAQVKEPKAFNEDWSKPYQPFRIAGNLYYVGTYDLACYLITTSKGNILINTGLAASASQIEENVKALGFKFSDIKILLTTQAHFDHVAAMAAIKKKTGAQMMVNEKDAPVLADGGFSDFAFGGSTGFEPVKADRLLKPDDAIQLGDMQIKMLHHPGHTKGSCSYLFAVKDDQRSYKVLIANMPTIVIDKKVSEVATYPTMSDDLANTFKSLKSISFDLWLASHAGQFNMHSKRKPGDAYNPLVFADRKGFESSLADLEKQFENKK
jgi:metallo-beta-lactamase class B